MLLKLNQGPPCQFGNRISQLTLLVGFPVEFTAILDVLVNNEATTIDPPSPLQYLFSLSSILASSSTLTLLDLFVLMGRKMIKSVCYSCTRSLRTDTTCPSVS